MKWTKLVLMWSMCVLLFLAHGASGAESDERWMEVQDNISWTTPDNVLGPTDSQDAWCVLEGFACYEQAWNGTPMLVGEAIEIVSVELTFTFWSAVIANIDDRFEIKYGIGDVAILTPPTEWFILEVITAGSAPLARVYNVTGDKEEWTQTDIFNIYLKVEGFEDVEVGDTLTFYWDSGHILYQYRVIADVVIPDDNGGDGGPSARNTWDILAMLLILLFLLILIYLFMKWTQDRFEREVP